jgi:hypothetical protein
VFIFKFSAKVKLNIEFVKQNVIKITVYAIILTFVKKKGQKSGG